MLTKNRPLLQRKSDFLYVIYFLIHIAVSLAIDSAIVVPKHLQPEAQQRLVQYHIQTNQDFLLLDPPAWLKGFCWIELLFQVPFFLIAALGLIYDSVSVYRMCLIYGVEAAITTFACLVEIATYPDETDAVKLNLFFIYLPTFLIPLYIVFDFYDRLGLFLPKKAKLT